MTTPDQHEVKTTLDTLRENIIVRMSAGKKKIMENEGKLALGSGMEPGDCSALHLTSYLNICQMESCTDMLAQVDVARENLRNGSYGRCSLCQNPIEAERLHFLPFATHCLDCQQDIEETSLRDHFRLL